jgi:glyceraldehyde-3-phosphate dehydrogenase/erythrose-4-phosphate dehydrogenase
MPTVAINGLGRIGRAALKILLDSDGLDVAAVNDIAAADNLAYLRKYDTVYGRYHRQVSASDGALVVDDRRIPVFSERDPGALPWGDLGVDRQRLLIDVPRIELTLSAQSATSSRSVARIHATSKASATTR